MSLDRRIFFNQIRPLFGGRLNQPQVEGMDALLNSWERRGDSDARWLAYMLATAFHETNRTMQPVREAYWVRNAEDWRRRNLRYYPYYGRGFVQLTWQHNYDRAGDFIGTDLVRNPDLALLPQNAATIMLVGMEAGWFRGDSRGRHTLGRYFNRSVNDPVGAREIINGREFKTINGRRVLLATIIAGYHDAFLRAITLATARSAAGIDTTFDMASLAADEGMFPASFGPAPGDTLPDSPALSRGATFTSGDFTGTALDPAGPGDAFFPDLVTGADDIGLSPMTAEDFTAGFAAGSDLRDYTVEIVTAFLGSGNKIDAAGLPDFIIGVHRALTQLTLPEFEPPREYALMEAAGDMAEPEPAPKPASARKRSRSSKPKEYQHEPIPENA